MTVAIMTQAADRHLPVAPVSENVPFEVVITWLKAELEAADEYVVAGPFPDDAFCLGSTFFASSEDLDVGGTETLDIKIGFGDIDGVINSAATTLYTSAGTEVENVFSLDFKDLDNVQDPGALAGLFYPIGGLYLIFEIVTVAATGGANGVATRVGFQYTRQYDLRTAT